MGFMDELKKLARPYAEDDEDDYDDYDNDDFEDEEDEAPEPAPRARRSAAGPDGGIERMVPHGL